MVSTGISDGGAGNSSCQNRTPGNPTKVEPSAIGIVAVNTLAQTTVCSGTVVVVATKETLKSHLNTGTGST